MAMTILILCTGNSCRSQMAEGWLNSFDDRLYVFSAGTAPSERMHPLAVQVMAEAGVDLSHHLPKSVDQFLHINFDYVITVCDHANETCPVFLGTVKHRLHLGFADPAAASGSDEEILSVFRCVRDEIKKHFLSLYEHQMKPEIGMTNKSWGFIGGGRVTRILLEGFQRAQALPQEIIISDINADVLNHLKLLYPQIKITTKNREAAAQEHIFLALHPPAISGALEEIKTALQPDAVMISLAPKFTIEKLAALLGFQRIARMLPLATSFINLGHNPCAFAASLPSADKTTLLRLFGQLGACPEMAEEKIEGFAVAVAMAPTYLWFQLQQLRELGRSFGLEEDELNAALPAMTDGAVKLLFGSGLTPAEVMDLIPVKPLGEDEEAIKAMYHNRLTALFQKLKG
jgi:pyrroline-5-carboxylate reductase